MKLCKKIIFIMMLSLLFPVMVFGAGSIDLNTPASLTIHALCGKNAVEGMEFRGYFVSDIDETGELTVTEQLASYKTELNIRGKNDSAWEAMAVKLEEEILKNTSLKAAVYGKTDKAGKINFQNIKKGLYLFVADGIERNDKVYTASSFFAMVPGQDPEKNEWKYDVTVNAKAEENPILADYKVIKVWKDSCHKDQRPKKIEIVLMCDGKEYDKVTLPENGHWQHTWKDLETGHKWTVTEKQQDGYKEPEITQKGYTFTVTNTCSRSDSTGGSKLPQTGQLWWPIPVLVCAGLLFIVFGLIRRRGEDHEK